jgi:hypothetical protein
MSDDGLQKGHLEATVRPAPQQRFAPDERFV